MNQMGERHHDNTAMPLPSTRMSLYLTLAGPGRTDKICTEKEQKGTLIPGGKLSFREKMMRPEFSFETTEGPTGRAVP